MQCIFFTLLNVFLCFFSKICENKGPVMRQGLLTTWLFVFFVACFDTEQLENSSYSLLSKNLFDFKKLNGLLLWLESRISTFVTYNNLTQKLAERRQCTTKAVLQSTTRIICSGLKVNRRSWCDSRYSTNIQMITFC